MTEEEAFAFISEITQLVEALADPGECRLDHDGNCQEHAWFDDGTCPHARAKEFLARSRAFIGDQT